MIYPVQSDVGRAVSYNDGRKCEEGRISSLPPEDSPYHETHVFVRFSGPQGELIPCDKLEWLS